MRTVAQLTDWLEKTAHVVDGEPMAPPPMGSEPSRPDHI